jgi:hypothetical protein
MHITSYLYGETPEAVLRFLEAACRCPAFREVIPVRRDDGQVIAVAFLTIEDDDWRMPGAVARLSGILGREVEIVAARESAAGAVAHHRRAWLIPGRSSEVRRGQVIAGTLEITPGPSGS